MIDDQHRFPSPLTRSLDRLQKLFLSMIDLC
jgi:hypothetical protein